MSAAVLRQRLALALIASLWLLPLLLPLSQRPLIHFHREWLAAALALGACALWLPLRGQPIVVPRTALFLLVFAAYLLAQTFLVQTPYREPAIGYAMYLGWAALLVTAAAGVRERLGAEPVIRAISWAALAGAILAAAIGAMQAFGIPDWLASVVWQEKDSRVRGHLQHASYYADQLLLGVAAAAFLFATRALRLWMLVPALVVIGLALALAGSRMTVLVLAALPLYALAMWAWRRDAGNVRLVAATVLSVSTFLFCEWALAELPWLAQQWTRDSTLTRLPTEAGGMELRWVLWQKALETFLGSPLFGAGVDAFPWNYFRLLDSRPPLPYTIHSHNLFTESLACYGLIGTGLLVAMFAAFAWQYRQRLATLAWWPVSMMLGILFLRALLDLNFWFAHLLALFAVLLGLADVKGARIASRLAPAGLALATAGGAAMLAVTLADYRLLTGIGETRTDAREVVAGLQSARRNPFFTALADSMIADGRPVSARGDRRQLVLHSRSFNWRPTPRMVWRQSALLAANGYPEQACRLMARAWRIHPGSAPGVRRLLAPYAETPAFATLISQLDALQAGRGADVLCAAPAIAGAPR